MVPKVDPPKFPEMLNAITENVRDSYAGMVFIDDPEDLDSWGFTKEQLDELDSFAQKYGLTDVLEINEWNPDSKPDYILSAFSGLVDKIDDLQGRIRPKANDVSIENFICLNQVKAGVPEPDQLAHAKENDHIHSFFSDYETEWRSNILFDDLDEALRYCEDVRSGFISDIQLHSSFIMYKEPGFKAMPGGGFAGWSDLFYAAHGNLEYANKLLFDCQAGDRDGMDPRRCAREDLINGVIAEFGSEYIMTGDAGQKNRLNSAEILRFELDSVPTDGNGHITGYFHGFPLGTSLEDISAAIDNVGKVENGHPNRIDVPEEPERIEPEQNVGVSNEKPTVTEIEDSSIREPKSHPTQSGKPVWTNLEVPPDNVRLLTGVSRKTDRPWYRADCTLGEESSIKPGGKFKILLSERQYARADAQKKAGKPVSLGLKTARYPDGVEIDGEMVALEDLAADINVRKTNPLPKSPEEYRGATEQSFDGNEWVNFRFFPDLVDLSKSIDPDTARTDYRADVTSEVAGRNCSFTLHLAKWQYDKAVKDQNQNSPIHIGMKLKYIKGGVIPVQFEGEQSTHNYSPKKLEESLPKVQKARSVSGCRQGKGNRVSSYQDRSYRFKTKEAYEHGLPGAHESRN